MSAAIYIRWSTDDQATGTTLEEQRSGCLKWAAEKGLRVSPEHIFIDDGVSGAKENRPALNRLNRLIQQGAISVVIVYKLDRLARKPYLAYKLVEKDWHNKASLVSVTEAHIDTTTTVGQLGFGIAAVFASHERNTIRDRTMSGKRRRAAEGRNPGLRPPFGYAVHDKRFIIADDEAVVVRRVYEEYLGGRTDGQISRRLNDEGVRTRAGGPWHISAVQRLLTNPAYKGTLAYKEIASDGAFPVIIDADRWEHVQAIRAQKSKSHPRRLGSESPYILSGRLFCAKCGRPMNGRVSRNGRWENRYYACTGYIQFRDCDCLTVRKELLEAAVVAHLLPLLDEDDLSRRIARRVGSTVKLLQQEVVIAEARLEEMDRVLVRVRQDYRRSKIDADTFNDLRAEIEAEKTALGSALHQKKAALASAEDALHGTDDVRQAASLLRVWAELPPTQQKRVIHLLAEKICWDYQSQRLTIQTTI